jgi:hypothetical protein
MDWNRSTRWLLIAVVLIGSCSLLVLQVIGMRYRKTLQGLSADQVVSLTVESSKMERGGWTTQSAKLDANDIKTFLVYLKQAKSYAPNHPQRGWNCLVRIETTDRSFTFPIHATLNDGVHLDLASNGRIAWSYGTLRNDAFKEFLEDAFRRQRIAPGG